jgi:hypothetical protein
LLRIGFEGSDLGTVARLSQRSRTQTFEALSNLDECGGQALGGDVGLAENIERGSNLELVKFEVGFEPGN